MHRLLPQIIFLALTIINLTSCAIKREPAPTTTISSCSRSTVQISSTMQQDEHRHQIVWYNTTAVNLEWVRCFQGESKASVAEVVFLPCACTTIDLDQHSFIRVQSSILGDWNYLYTIGSDLFEDSSSAVPPLSAVAVMNSIASTELGLTGPQLVGMSCLEEVKEACKGYAGDVYLTAPTKVYYGEQFNVFLISENTGFTGEEVLFLRAVSSKQQTYVAARNKRDSVVLFETPLLFQERTSYTANVTIRAVGSFELRVILMLRSNRSAQVGRETSAATSVEEIYGEFCGDTIAITEVEIPSRHCSSGNVAGYWDEIEIAAVLPSTPLVLYPMTKKKDAANDDDDDVRPMHALRWRSLNGCEFREFDQAALEARFRSHQLEEILFLGDSRERDLARALVTQFGANSTLFDKHDSFWNFNPSLSFESADGAWKCIFINCRTNIKISSAGIQQVDRTVVENLGEELSVLSFEESRRVWPMMTVVAMGGIKEAGACGFEKKGILFFTLPLWDLRNVNDDDLEAATVFLSSLKEFCPLHEIVVLTPTAVHEDVTWEHQRKSSKEFLLHRKLSRDHIPGTESAFQCNVMSRFIFAQNRVRQNRAREIMIEAAKENEMRAIDLFTPTTHRGDRSVDGVHYENSTNCVLLQLIWNSIF